MPESNIAIFTLQFLRRCAHLHRALAKHAETIGGACTGVVICGGIAMPVVTR